MKISAKDLTAGCILLAFAIAGLWLNTDHTLGTARRMGPGYMPMLTFGILFGLGTAVVIMSFFTGPDPLERWALRELTLILTAIIVFGTILETAGMMVSMVICIAIASLADRTHKPLGVLALILFLCALCWLVFIRWLDIRIPVWPTIFGFY